MRGLLFLGVVVVILVPIAAMVPPGTILVLVDVPIAGSVTTFVMYCY